MISGYLKELENHPPIILDQLQLEKIKILPIWVVEEIKFSKKWVLQLIFLKNFFKIRQIKIRN